MGLCFLKSAPEENLPRKLRKRLQPPFLIIRKIILKKSNMAVSRLLKNRIRATKNITPITRATHAVSAVKMRKSQAAALQARPYALAALEVLKNIRSAAGHDVRFFQNNFPNNQ